MYIFFAVIIVIASLLLIGAVLIQKSKGGGLASNYAGGNQYMGYRKTTDFIEKATWGLAIVICVLSICCSFVLKAPVQKSNIVETPAATAAPGTAKEADAKIPAQKAAPATQKAQPAVPAQPAGK